jgi:hypothetical protein
MKIKISQRKEFVFFANFAKLFKENNNKNDVIFDINFLKLVTKGNIHLQLSKKVKIVQMANQVSKGQTATLN